MVGDHRPYGGAWDGPIFVLTHHPEDATPADGVTFLNCGPAEAVRIGLAAAGGKNLEVFSPTIGRQLLDLGLIDEIDIHIAPVLLGDGIRLYRQPRRRPDPPARGRRGRPHVGPQHPIPTRQNRADPGLAGCWRVADAVPRARGRSLGPGGATSLLHSFGSVVASSAAMMW